MKPRIKCVICAGVQYVSINMRSSQSQTAGFVSLSRSWAKNKLVKQMGKWEAGITTWAKWKFLGNLNCKFLCFKYFLWNWNLFLQFIYISVQFLWFFTVTLMLEGFCILWCFFVYYFVYYYYFVYAFQAFSGISFPEIHF